jgi:translation initiation factor 1
VAAPCDDAQVARRENARLVYSTDAGRRCPLCAHPIAECRCRVERDNAVPARVVAKLRIEKSGRGGKTVTVVYDLPRNAEFLKSLCRDLKRTCGTGGAVVDDTVELQGDLRERVRRALSAKGIAVKG